MNTPIEISNLAEYINLINEITYPGVSYLYRGQENAEWRVTSSAYRRLTGQTDTAPDLLERQTDAELNLLLERETDAEPGLLLDLFVGYLKQVVDEIQLRYPSTYRDLSH